MNRVLKALPVAFLGSQVFEANQNMPSVCPVCSLQEGMWLETEVDMQDGGTKSLFPTSGWSLSGWYDGSDCVGFGPFVI